MYSSEPLPGYAFGAIVTGLDSKDIGDEEVGRALNDLWIDRGLIIFRDMPDNREVQCELSQVFGDFELHPIISTRIPERPEMIAVVYDPENYPQKSWVTVVDGEERGGALPWHSDLIYADRINRGGLLRPVKMPSRGGHTGFIDQIDLYNHLPDDVKAAVEDLKVIYHFQPQGKKFGRPIVNAEGRPAPGARKPENYPLVTHPMVYTQKETDRKVLNVSPYFATAIEGMENAEGDALLARVVEHCEDERFAYYHHWTKGDMVLWDNWRMLHNGYGIPPDETRRVERTTIKGDYLLGRTIRAAASSDEWTAPQY